MNICNVSVGSTYRISGCINSFSSLYGSKYTQTSCFKLLEDNGSLTYKGSDATYNYTVIQTGTSKGTVMYKQTSPSLKTYTSGDEEENVNFCDGKNFSFLYTFTHYNILRLLYYVQDGTSATYGFNYSITVKKIS